MNMPNSSKIVVNINEKEYHFIVRIHPLAGKIIALFENGKEYGLLDKQIASRNKFIRSELTKLEHFNIDIFYDSPGWIWIGMDQYGFHAREATNSEVEVLVKLQGD
ncbi:MULTISPECIES: hypothetical protein [Bacillus]|uniref:hypothetical protein n=1 Tax=Bacillus TaxID=1386 RepID=UPI000992036A|nr:hypothetical protein [Bacillus cereus]OOQ93811.1 hypothetical protein BW898_18020 [Bacillus cereus]